MKKETTGTDVYSIRRAGETVCCSSIPNCGYTPETLRSMKQAGLYLYKNGKKEK